MRREAKAAWTLAFLGAFIPEGVSGSSPPLEILNPFAIAVFLGLYGAGALLVRESVIKYDKGWASILALGMAYGIFEEALTVKSWFDPGWVDLGPLSWYGRYLGVNWVWAVQLTIWHATVSIAFMIFLLDLFYPDLKGKRLLSDRQLAWPALSMLVVLLLGFFLMTPYRPGFGEYLFAVILMAVLIAVALAVPRNLLTGLGAVPPAKGWPFYSVGAAWMSGHFIVPGIFVALDAPPALTIAAWILLTLFALQYLRLRLAPFGCLRHLFLFFVGVMSPMLFFGLVAGQTPAFLGMNVVAMLFILWMARIYRNRWIWVAGVPPAARTQLRPEAGGVIRAGHGLDESL